MLVGHTRASNVLSKCTRVWLAFNDIPPSLAVSKLQRCRSYHKSCVHYKIDLFALHTRQRNFLERNAILCAVSLARTVDDRSNDTHIWSCANVWIARMIHGKAARFWVRLGRSHEVRSRCSSSTTSARARLRPRGGRSEPRHGLKESPANSASLCMRLPARVSAWKCVFLAPVTWLLRLAHKRQKRRHRWPLLLASSRLAAAAYAKESSVEGNLRHGSPWGTGALVLWTKHLPEFPPLPIEHCVSTSWIIPSSLFFFFLFQLFPSVQPEFLETFS